MKKILFLLLVTTVINAAFAQDDNSSKFFKKENVFTGGTVNASFYNSITALGISPFLGYSFNKYLDLAISSGIYYQSQRDYLHIGDKLRFTSYGPGAFVRVFPAKFFFAQAHYEFNLLRTKYLPYGASSAGVGIEKYKTDVHSFLVGAGVSNGKDFPYQKTYYYFTVLWDIANRKEDLSLNMNSHDSPYKNNLGRAVPIFRAGYNIALFQGRK